MGAARTIPDPLGRFAQMLQACPWHSPAYVLYLGLGAEGAADMARILIEAPDGEGVEGRGPRGVPML